MIQVENISTEILRYYDHFVVPFTVGVIVLFTVVIYKYVRWFIKLPRTDKSLVWHGLFTRSTFDACVEVVSESLLHRKIFRVNPILGYMHMSLAFGWFLLIAVGWLEASMQLSGIVPLHAHVFYKFFAEPGANHGVSGEILTNVMDLLLLFVLSGVALAWFKRMRSRAMGMKRATKHTTGDRIALFALWFIFPARLLAESASSGLKGIDSFLTGNIGHWMVSTFGVQNIELFSSVMWWAYSILLAVFFVSMPFSRYMHIFTEIPLIFLRKYRLRSTEKQKSYDHFQVQACSRCGICIDPCQLQADAGIMNVQSVYFLRDRRYHKLTGAVAENCFMCGRCEAKCPVGIELNTLRLNSRAKLFDLPAEGRYSFVKGTDTSSGSGKVGFFAGCMTLLNPKTLRSMEAIFDAAGEEVWWADRNGGVCCGRPLKLAGEIGAAAKMMEYNKSLFEKHGITTLVTSCPICLRVFREEYNLQGIEVIHHTQYIQRLIAQGRLSVEYSGEVFTYHDPCELGRGSGIYDEPRAVITSIGKLSEVSQSRENAFCCGSGLANITISDKGQNKISAALAEKFAETGAKTIVTACPLCKKAIARNTSLKVADISEIVAGRLTVTTNSHLAKSRIEESPLLHVMQ